VFRAVLKSALLNAEPPKPKPSPKSPRIGQTRVLPPYLAEMGYEVRYHLARVEPWLRNGWKIVAKRHDYYPPGTTIDAPEFYAACRDIFRRHGVFPCMGALYIPPVEQGEVALMPRFEGESGVIDVSLSDLDKVLHQAQAEIELRNLFLDWFDYDGRPITDYDRDVFSFQGGSFGNIYYRNSDSLRPTYRPAAFEHPLEPMAPHVGVQIRALSNGMEQPRNSDPNWMCATAAAIGVHLDLPVLAYGHKDGCVLPPALPHTWREVEGEQGHLARELGYLKSCCLMLAPDSGWADLMAWLGVPTLLEMLVSDKALDGLRDTFQPRIAVIDRDRPLKPQVDALLADAFSLPTTDPLKSGLAKALFPWEP